MYYFKQSKIAASEKQFPQKIQLPKIQANTEEIKTASSAVLFQYKQKIYFGIEN